MARVFRGLDKRCRAMLTLISVHDFILTCLLCTLCLSMLQLVVIQRRLDIVLADYKALYYYQEEGKIINQSHYFADGRCLKNIQTKKKICFENKRIFYA